MILDYILIKGWEIINNFGYLSIIILVGFAQIFGCPTEITMPMIFGKYREIFSIMLAGISDFIAFVIIFLVTKPLSFKFRKRILTKREIIVYRMIPVVRGGFIPLISFGYGLKEIFPIIIITSFAWSIILYALSFFFNFWSFVHFVRKNEKYLLILLFGILCYKGIKMIENILHRK